MCQFTQIWLILPSPIKVFIDVDNSYASPSYGNAHVYQKTLSPPNTREVTYVNQINATGLESLIKHSMQYPKTCATL